jgi:hypothetical protein
MYEFEEEILFHGSKSFGTYVANACKCNALVI